MLRILNINRFLFTRCMILHPVLYPNKGPQTEQYLAQQAVGLASSLGWQIVKGPFWNYKGKNIIVPIIRDKLQQIDDGSNQEIRDGQYVDTPVGRGIKHGDGVIFDPYQSQTDGDLHKEWTNKLKRQSIANSSLIKTKRVTQKTYFTKGKLDPIAKHIQANDIDCIFINKQLKPTQIRNLTKILQGKINNIDQIYYNAGRSEAGQTQTQFETQDIQAILKRNGKSTIRKIKVFDRFSIILQIFAQRTTTKLSRLQIQLSFLSYLKTRLVREGSTFSSNLNGFYGDLMKTKEINMEIISAKQRRAHGTMSGQGQSQLEVERRNIKDKQAKIRRQIDQLIRLRMINADKSQNKASKIPVVALVGYTNVGKSAFMNAVMKTKQVQSKDLLFQTLSTTSRYVTLVSGKQINLLDTIGFITDLPVQLVQSFKSTLQQISHADLVIHLRDISSPMNNLQKKSVLSILQQLKFKQNFASSSMIEVWNKVDLLNQEQRKQFIKDQSAVTVSCTTGQGMKDLLKLIDSKLASITGSKSRVIQYTIDKHFQMVQWLKENTNLSYQLNQQYNYQATQLYPNGSVKLNLIVDDSTYGKIIKFIQGDDHRKVTRKAKGMPPKQGW